MSLIEWILKFFQLYGLHTRKKWRRNNRNNFTEFGGGTSFPNNIIIGTGTYGTLNVFNDCNDRYLRIGSFCSIATGVYFILGLDHSIRRVSSYPFKQMYNLYTTEQFESISKGDIVLDDDVWIGARATILSGVHIGQGAVIGAGCVVSFDVPAYSVVVGSPARVIKKRFDDDKIDFLMTLDYSRLTEELIQEHLCELYADINFLELKKMKSMFEWFPKKHN